MSRPTQPKGDVWALTRAKALLWRRAEVLADFEAETIREAYARVVIGGGVMSAAERLVVEDAMAAMLAAGTQDLTNVGLAA